MDKNIKESLKNSEREITCSICEKHFSEPKVLPCLHYYCKDCIISLTQQAYPGESISCPKCQYKLTLPNGDVSKLNDACFINRLKRKVERQRWFSDTNKAKCELCTANSDSKPKADKFCLDCDKFICESCVGQHSKWTTHSNHKMSSLDDLGKDQIDSILDRKPLAPLCHIHKQQSLDFYCYNCKCCICRLCILEKGLHEHHQYDKNSVVTSKIKEKLNTELDPIRKFYLKLKNTTAEVQEAKQDTIIQEESNIQQLVDSFDELDNILRKRKQELVNRARELSQDRIEKLSLQELRLSRASAEVQSLVSFTEQCVDQTGDYEFMNMHGIIENRMDQIMQEQGRIASALKPGSEEKVVIEVACAKDLQELCRSIVFVTKQSCPAKVNEATAIIECENWFDLTSRRNTFSKSISRILCPSCADCDEILLDNTTTIKPNVNCQVHNQEPLKYYCLDCEICICDQCREGKQHKIHKLENLKLAAKEIRNKLHKINLFPGLHKKLKETIIKIGTIKHEIKDQEKSVISNLRDSYRNLRKILLWSEQDHIEKVQIKMYEKLDRLLSQEKKISSAYSEVQSMSSFFKECVDHLSDASIMKLHTALAQRVEQELKKQYTMLLKDNLEPVERADLGIGVPSTEALQHLCETQASIFETIDPLNSSVDLNEAADVNMPFTASLVTRLSNNRQAKRSCIVSSKVKSLCNKVVSDCIIDDNGSGQYYIHFTPIIRGCHQLTILIDEQHVSGSPFSIFVSVNPENFTNPVRVWNNVTKPFGGTANSQHEILAIENYKSIIKLTPDGHTNVLVQNCELQKLSAIACDDKDNIFGVDELSNRIFTCNQNGDHIQVHEVELINSKGRGALLILDNELITTDRGETHDTLCVYNRELNLLKNIPLSNKVRDMSADSHGNLFVTDSNHCCIHIYKINGDYVKTLNFDSAYIQYPCGIYIFNQHVYLTDCTNHNVVVFTTEGTFITQIGREQTVYYPYKVFVDTDCFVYIFDFGNNKILCY